MSLPVSGIPQTDCKSYLVVDDAVQEELRIKFGQSDRLATLPQSSQHNHHLAVDMEERQHPYEGLVARVVGQGLLCAVEGHFKVKVIKWRGRGGENGT